MLFTVVKYKLRDMKLNLFDKSGFLYLLHKKKIKVVIKKFLKYVIFLFKKSKK